MERETSEQVEVRAESFFLEEQSSAEENHYVFAYRIKIRNLGNCTVQLLDRHWIITDSNGEVNEVRGDGVVGEQPVLSPGEVSNTPVDAILKPEWAPCRGATE